MKKIDKGSIWLILLLQVLCLKNVYAETFEGRWLSSQGRTLVATAIQANSLQDIIDGQYVFELTERTTVTIELNSSEDAYLYLLETNSTNQIKEIAHNDDYGGARNSRISKSLNPGKYIIAPTTFRSKKNTNYTLIVTFSPSSDDYIYSGVWSSSDTRNHPSIPNYKTLLELNTKLSGPKYHFTIDSPKTVRLLLDSTVLADSFLFLFKIDADGNATLDAADDDSGDGDIDGVNYSDRIGIGLENDSTGTAYDSYFSKILEAGDYIAIPISRSTNDQYKLYIFGAGSMAFNVVPPNVATEFSGNTSGVGNADNSISGTLTATDVEGLSGDYFAISVNPAQGTATIDQASGLWQYTPSANHFGAYTFTVTVTDDVGGTTSQVISLTVNSVNNALNGEVTINGTVSQGQTLTASHTLTDADGLGAISYQWQADGKNITEVDQSTYSLTQNEVNKKITVIASYTDNQGAVKYVTSDPTTAVVNINDAPVATNKTVDAIEQKEEAITLEGTDPDGVAPFVFKIFSLPTNGTLKDGGTAITGSLPHTVTDTLTYTSTSNIASTDSFTFKANDGELDSVDAATVTITITHEDDLAQFSGDTSGTGDEDNLISGTLTASDEEGLSGDYFAISVTPAQGTAKIDQASGLWQYTPSANYFGADSFTVKVTDDLDGTTTQLISLTINSVDDAAQFSGDTSGTGDEDNLISGTLTASDEEGLSGDYFAISVTPAQGTATIDQASGLWQYTPSANYFGADSFTVTVTDDQEGTSFHVINIALTAINDSPIFTSNGITTATENQLYSYSATISDVEGNAVSFSGASIPDWLTFNPSTGILTGTPAHVHAQVGTHAVVIRADDGTDSVEQSFTIAVNDVNNPPTVTLNVNSFIEDAGGLVAAQSVAASYEIEDLDGDELSVNFEQGSNTNNHYSLDTAEQKILLTQIGIDTINRGDPLDPISLNVIEVNTNQSSSSGGSSSQPTDPDIPDIPIEDPFDEVSSSPTDNEDSSAVSVTATPEVKGVNDLPGGEVTISGIVAQGEKLTATNTLSDEDGIEEEVNYQWQADNEIITGATQSTYQLTQSDLGKTITVVANYTDADGNEELKTSNSSKDILDSVLQQLLDDIKKNNVDLYQKAGISGVTEENIGPINDAIFNKREIITEESDSSDQQETIQVLVNKVVVSQVIQNYRGDIDNIDNTKPKLIHYQDLGLTNSDVDIQSINDAIVKKDALAIDSIAKIEALLTTDTDSDQVIDLIDNCPDTPNESQANYDNDDLGDKCDSDEDGDGVVSAEDAFKFNADYSKDTDGDGMADVYERQHGFDVSHSGDKLTDSDGDGVSNLDEFLARTDPRVNPNPGLPQLSIPDDIVITSTGRQTSVDLGVATATDGSQVALAPVASFTGPFSAGRHEITWSATDALGNQSKAVQVVKILPLVNLTPSSLVAEGGRVEVSVVLSGDAADYPVVIPYEISGSAKIIDYQLEGTIRAITIEEGEGRKAGFGIKIKVDDELENDETIEIKLNKPTNAILGSVTQRTISIIDGNLPPQISVNVKQGDNQGRVIAADKGNVIITAEVSDPNPGDSLNFDWQLESQQETAVVSKETQDDKKILVIDPSQLKPGVFSIAAKATDSSVEMTEVKIDFRLLEAAPNLSTEIDSDGDGVLDADEGYDDEDNDGIVDYMDNIVESNLAPISEDSSRLLQAPVGTQIVLGEMAFANAKNSVLVNKEQVIQIITERQLQLSEGIDDEAYNYPVGLYDFTISGAIPGRSYYLVIPLPMEIEKGQIFRKYMGSKVGWQNFIENAKNTLFSAKALDGACPEPASRLYDYGLQPGHNCIQIYIEDGGPNDADGKADGIVTDPAGIAIYNGTVEENTVSPVEAPSSSLSTIKLSQAQLFVKGDTSTITIVAFSNDGKLLENVNISAKCIFCLGVGISQFTQTKPGVYEALITSGRQINFGFIEAELTNEFGSAKLTPQKLNVGYRPSGGCTVVVNGRSDISLFLMLILLTLYHRRKNL